MTSSVRRMRIGVLEDQPLYREMLERLLRSVPGFEVVSAGSVHEALSTWRAAELDVALLDFELPDGTGLDVGRALQQRNPRLGVVLLSAVDRSLIMLELDQHEAERWSYLSKHASISTGTLIRTLHASSEGRSVIDHATVKARVPRAGGRVEALSERQREVLALLAEGYTNQSIADRLSLAVNSVNNHVNALYIALGVNESSRNPRVSAVRIFLEETR